jgi:branched-chain amino acid transport system substrate-binding protein
VAGGDAVRLASLNHAVALLGGVDAANAVAIEQAARPYGLGVVASANASEPGMDDAPFSLAISAAYQGQVLARFVKDGLDPRPTRVLVLIDTSAPRARSLADGFLQEMKGGSIETDRASYKNDSDIPDLIGEIKRTRPTAVLLAGSSAEFVRKLRSTEQEFAPGVRWLYGGEDVQITALQQNRGASESLHFATIYVVDCGSDLNTEFARRYRERFDEDPDVHAALAYDSARCLFEAMRRCKTLTVANIHDEITETEKFSGLTGTFTFSKGRLAQRPVFIVRIKNGQAVRLKTDG